MSNASGRTIWAMWTQVVALSLASIAWAGERGRVSATSLPPAASLRFETTSLRLGEIRGGLPFACQFAFVNAGQNNVELVEARPGCGCLKPRFEERQIAPGKHGTIPLEVQTVGQPAGPHTWQLTVLYRDGDQLREQALQVTATVVTEVSVQPASLTLFTEGVSCHDVTLTDLRPQPLQILDVQVTSPFLRAEAGPFNKDGFGNFTCKIKVCTAGDLPVGRHDEMLIIHTSDPLYREFKIPITVVKRVSQADPYHLTSTPKLAPITHRLDWLKGTAGRPRPVGTAPGLSGKLGI